MGELLQNVFEGLVIFNDKNEIVPAVAEKWDISPDGKVYTFHLRPGIKFHNGRVLTAEDVKYSLERAVLPETKSPTGPNYLVGVLGLQQVLDGKTKHLEGLKIVDAGTVQITLDKPRSYFLGTLAYISNAIVCKEAIEGRAGGMDPKGAVGTGPFQLSEYRSGSMVVLVANLAYRMGRPKLDRIERPIVINMQTAHAKFEAGETDQVDTTVSDYKSDSNDPRLKNEAKVFTQAGTWYIGFQERLQPLFKDRRVRRAIAMAIDKDDITRIASSNAYPRADCFVPPGMMGHNDKINRIPFDPSGAKKLLAEAGFPGGQGLPQLTLVYAESNPETAAAAQRIRALLKANLGVEIETQEREAATFFRDTGANERVPFYLGSWFADYLDPQDFLSAILRTGAPINHLAYSNPKFDALCDAADSESDQNKRAEMYKQADQIAMDDAAIIPIFHGAQPALISSRVINWKPNLMFPAAQHLTTSIGK